MTTIPQAQQQGTLTKSASRLVVPFWVRAQFCHSDIYYGDHLYITDIAPPARITSEAGNKWWLRHSSCVIATLCELMGVPVRYGGTEEAIRQTARLIERIRQEPAASIRVECEPSEHWLETPRLTGNLWHAGQHPPAEAP